MPPCMAMRPLETIVVCRVRPFFCRIGELQIWAYSPLLVGSTGPRPLVDQTAIVVVNRTLFILFINEPFINMTFVVKVNSNHGETV